MKKTVMVRLSTTNARWKTSKDSPWNEGEEEEDVGRNN